MNNIFYVNMCSGILPFRNNLPTTPYQQECEFLQSQPVGRRESFSKRSRFIMSSTFGSALLTTIYRNVTYFHNVSRDLTATFLYFRKFSHLTTRHTTYCTHDKGSPHFSHAASQQAYDTYLVCWHRSYILLGT